MAMTIKNGKLLLGLLAGIFMVLTVNTGHAEDKILVFRKKGKDFKTVYEAMKKVLTEEEEIPIEDFIYANDYSYGDFKSKLNDVKPSLMVLMDNQIVKYGQKYNSESSKKIKGVALMGLNLKAILDGDEHISGIAYETPAFTLITQFRNTMKRKVKDVLVLYRKSQFENAVMTAQQRLAGEQISLKAVNVEENGKGKDDVISFVKSNLPSFAEDKSSYNLIWVMLDSGLLNRELFGRVWIPTARKNTLPFISGTEKFVSKKFDFCVFGISPDLNQYGDQAAQMIFTRLEAEEGEEEDLEVEDLIAVKAVLNSDKAEKMGFEIDKSKLSEAGVKLAQ